jgi:uncharacterized membrane protein
MLLFAIILKLFPPKKPNFYYGYQLGNAKKSPAHWKIANKHASQYLIILYSFLTLVSVLFDVIDYDGGILLLAILTIALIFIYFSIERKLKKHIG